MAIEQVLVIGAGTMGHGIAHVAALAGYQARLFDVQPDVVKAGLAKVCSEFGEGCRARQGRGE